MNFLGIGNIIKAVGEVADDLLTSEEEILKIQLQEKQIDASLMLGQQAINAVEAKHQSVFVAGARPFIIWVAGAGIAYQFLLYPVLMWVAMILKAKGVIPVDTPEPPVMDSGPLFALVTTLLGLGGMRSFDKVKNVASLSARKR